MAKQYATASLDVLQRIERVRKEYHPQLGGVTIGALFVFGEEPQQVLEHQGYPALATIKPTSTKDRAAGLLDALLIVDRYAYEGLTDPQKDAMVDHELYHLERVTEDDGTPKFDSNGRPKLSIRKHDRQFGWFDEVAHRHGDNSLEVIQAKSIIASTRQLYFPFYRQTAEAA